MYLKLNRCIFGDFLKLHDINSSNKNSVKLPLIINMLTLSYTDYD